jgi:O-antigen chain-terminating methyltransferase
VKALSAELDASRAARAFPLRRTVATSTDGARPTVDLLRLEDRFRGSEEDIVERQRPYLRHFTGAAPVLDIGCGRGEFLEVLRGEGIDAYGVDLDESMVGHSRAKNLRVVHGDGLEHLASLEDGALGGIFAAQVIEHLDVAQVITLADLCAAKLRPGGVVLLESVNPRVALALQNFYIDFTHIRPYDPEAVAWLLESKGFTNLSVEYSMPSAELHVPPLQAAGVDAAAFDDAIARMNDVLYGPRAYAVVATKRV